MILRVHVQKECLIRVSVSKKRSERCLWTVCVCGVGGSESWISQRWRVMVMTGLETMRGRVTRLTTGGLWGTWSQHGLMSQIETASSLIPCWLTPTQHHMHTGMRRQPRDTAPHGSKLDMNQRGQSSHHRLLSTTNFNYSVRIIHFRIQNILPFVSLAAVDTSHFAPYTSYGCLLTWAADQILLPSALPSLMQREFPLKGMCSFS